MLETLLTAEVQHKFTWMWFSLPWRYFMVRAAPSREISQRGYNNFIIFRYYMTKYSFTRKYKEPNGTHKLLETYTSMKAQVKGIIWILYSLYSRKKKKKISYWLLFTSQKSWILNVNMCMSNIGWWNITSSKLLFINWFIYRVRCIK